MRKIGSYSPTDKITSSFSFDRSLENSWIRGRKLLQTRKQSIGDFLLEKLDEEVEKQVTLV